MFSKTNTLVFIVATALSTMTVAQTSSAKLPAMKTETAQNQSKKATASSKVAAKSAKTLVAVKGESVSIAQLNTMNLNANASSTSQVLHPVAGRSIFQAVPKSTTSTLEEKFGKQPTATTETRTNAVGIEFSRGLTNDIALNISTDIGSESVKPKKGTEKTNTGLSDLKVEISKMNQQDMQQTFFAGHLTSSLDRATRGNVAAGNKNIDGNRFSGGMTLGGSYTKQNSALLGNYGYKLSATLQFNRKYDIQQTTPVYSAVEMAGGHMIGAEAFAEKMLGQASKIGGTIGLDMILPVEGTWRNDNVSTSVSKGQYNVMSLKAFAALSAGQLEFIPTAIFQKNVGSSGGNLSIESSENVGLELTTRFSL